MRQTLADAVRTVLDQALAADTGLVVLGDAVVRGNPATAGLAEARPDQVQDWPVADRGTLGAALGLALAGRRVVVELAGTGRLSAGLEVLREAAAIARAGEFPVTLAVRVPYGEEAVGLDAPVGALLAGIDAVCPSSPARAASLLRLALDRRTPTVILEPRAALGSHAGRLSLQAEVLREGRHVTLAAWGAGVQGALDAAEALAAEGIEADVVDLVSLSPLDGATLGARVRATGRLVVVHPGDEALAAKVREVAVAEAFLYLEAPLALAPANGPEIAQAARGAVHY